jgi:hypothetical protein
LACLYGYVIGALKRNLFYYEEVLKGTADGEGIAAAAGDGEVINDRGEDAFFEGDQQGPQGIEYGTHGGNQNNNNNNEGDNKDDNKDKDNNQPQQQNHDEKFQ